MVTDGGVRDEEGDPFDGDDPGDVIHRHLGSSIRVVEE